LDALAEDDLRDHIDLTLPRPATDTVAVALNLRNSLLNTVLFYEYMLDAQGMRAIDWMARELNSLSAAVQLGDFYARHMGLQVHVWDDTAYTQVDKVGEVGPIAWDEAAVLVPVPSAGDSLRVRLSFIADAWRIDEVRVATTFEHTMPVHHPLARLRTTADPLPPEALDQLRIPDTDYTVTLPGQRFWAEFDVPPAREASRTFFVAAQGYYTEWMRRHWVEGDQPTASFTLDEALLYDAIQHWRTVQPTYEARFDQTKIPVR
jgi:hypothetical protein